MQKIKPLQDLRGIAILMVVLFHSGNHFTELVSHGNNGVLLFFMISGFIISSAHSKDSGIGNFVVFMKKRISRIHFPYIPIATMFIVLFAISGKGSSYHHDPLNILRNLLLIQDPSESIHPYSWTLVFEMFYYVCFGVLSILLNRGLLPFLIVLSLPPIVYAALGGDETRNLILSFYNLYFVVGVLLVNFVQKFTFKSPMILVLVSLMVFLILPFYTDNQFALLIATTLFFYSYLNIEKNSKLLEKIGDASYTIYLSHALVLTLGKYVITHELARFIVLFILSMALGYAYFYFTEKKLTRIGRRVLGLSAPGTNKAFHRTSR